MEAELHNPARAVRVRSGSHAVAWLLLVVAVGVATVGATLGWSDRWVWYDEAIHVFSFFAITLLAALYLYGAAMGGYPRHKLLMVFTVVCVAVTLGVAWEWAELAYDRVTGRESVIKGKFDTLLDLVMDGLGGAIAGMLMLAMFGRRTRAADQDRGVRTAD